VTGRSSEGFLTHAPADLPVPSHVHGATLQSIVSNERHMELGIIGTGNAGTLTSAFGRSLTPDKQ
jgi:hypothetical protein